MADCSTQTCAGAWCRLPLAHPASAGSADPSSARRRALADSAYRPGATPVIENRPAALACAGGVPPISNICWPRASSVTRTSDRIGGRLTGALEPDLSGDGHAVLQVQHDVGQRLSVHPEVNGGPQHLRDRVLVRRPVHPRPPRAADNRRCRFGRQPRAPWRAPAAT